MALGHVATGALTNNAEWMDALRRAGDAVGEKIWELPAYDEYRKQIRSEIADLKNSGGRPGGAITAGLFLKEFVDDTPWVHLDIAGTARTDQMPHLAKGPTGVMTRTFVHLAEALNLERTW
jgi:leucyl aminopeptidase